MPPEKPPLPTPWYFPFQPAAGIQTSSLMSESLVGLISAVTRQKAGNSLKVAGAGPAGGSNAPAATNCAEVMVVSGSLRLLKLSHGAAKAGCAATRMIAITRDSRKRTRAVPHISLLVETVAWLVTVTSPLDIEGRS